MFIKYFLALILISYVVCDTNYRLNTKVIPSEYEITITPYFNTSDDRAFTFDGQVTIKVTTAEFGIKQIKLHSQDLNYNSSDITVRNSNGIVLLNDTNPLEFNTTYRFAYINLKEPLTVNIEYDINIVYIGRIRNDLVGFYSSYYIENNTTKWLAATQLSQTHARKVFPCFDEPQLKAKFVLVIDRPENYSPTLTNTKLQNTTLLNNGYVRERFYPTPIMSTYLIAIIISEFSNAGRIQEGKRKLGVLGRPEVYEQSKYAFDFGKKAINALSDYFGVDFYSIDKNLNLNNVAVPDSLFTAMENWGLITYKEEFLMNDPLETTPHYKFYTAQTIAHELTHMWFGNLVTAHWWNDVWLKEAFPNYFQDYITAIIEPELGAADVQVTLSSYGAYTADEVQNPAPLTNSNVNSPAEIAEQFSTISYDKGSSIIRMIHHWIGDVAFKKGLNEILNVGALGIITPSMLYDAFETGVKCANSLEAYPGYNLTNVMSKWVSQAGHPIINVSLNQNSGQITLTQNRFYANSSFQSDNLYPIPITYTTQTAVNFDNTKPEFIMSNKTHTFGNFSNTDWVIFNLQETGFYRVNYDDHLWSMIGKVLSGPNRTSIHHLNRAKVVNDLFALAGADHVNFETLFDRLGFLAEETEYPVWVPALNGLYNLRGIMLGSSDVCQLDAFIKKLIERVVQNLGFNVRESDSFVTLRNRMQINLMACTVESGNCVDQAVSLFRNFRETGKSIAPSLRPVVYCLGLRYGTTEDYDFMYQRKINMSTKVVSESLVIENALSCTRDKGKLHSYLQQIISNGPYLRATEFKTPLNNVLSNSDNFQVAFDFLKENYVALKEKISDVLYYFPYSAIKSTDLAQYESWVAACTECPQDEVKSVLAYIQPAKSNQAWKEKRRIQIVDGLKKMNITCSA